MHILAIKNTAEVAGGFNIDLIDLSNTKQIQANIKSIYNLGITATAVATAVTALNYDKLSATGIALAGLALTFFNAELERDKLIPSMLFI